MNKIVFILIILISFLNKVYSQCKVDEYVFKTGEKLTYNVYYNWGFIWVSAGSVDFLAKDTLIKNKTFWHFVSTGTSYASYDWIYKVRDKYESISKKTNLEPLYYKRKTSEGGYDVNNKYIFNKKREVIYTFTENSKTPYKKDTIKYQECIFDVLSATYFTRCIDFDNIDKTKSIPIKILIDNEIVTIEVKYIDKEIIEDKDEKKYNTIKFSTTVVEGSVFKAGEEINVWVSDDENKIPLLIEAKILVGSVKVYLKKKENIKYEFKSLVK